MRASLTGRLISWGLLVALGSANVAGYALDLYQRFWWFDRALHAGTIFALTLWLALIVFARAVRDGRPILTLLLMSSVGLAVGALWEVAEWAFDQFASSDVIKGKNDTIIDIVMDTGGAILAGAGCLAFLRPTGESDGAGPGVGAPTRATDG
jgi:hypothetical protein